MTQPHALDYAKPSSLNPLRQGTGLVALVLASLLLAALGSQCFYRWYLFLGPYGAKLNQNHVADGFFIWVYGAALTAVLMALLATWLLPWRPLRWLALLVALLNGLMGGAFFLMGYTGVLVEYSRWAP
ncbi:MAG: hypothetical protein WCJ97_02505 [Phycisphaerae bacterium]